MNRLLVNPWLWSLRHCHSQAEIINGDGGHKGRQR